MSKNDRLFKHLNMSMTGNIMTTDISWFRIIFSGNENLPAVFGVIGHKDGLAAMLLPGLADCAKIFPDFSFYLAPDAPHGVGLGTGTRNYVNAFTQLAQWPQMAINFIESRIGLAPKSYDLNQTMQSW